MLVRRHDGKYARAAAPAASGGFVVRTLLTITMLAVTITACPEASSQGPSAPAKAPVVEAPPTVAGPLGELLATYDDMPRRFANAAAPAGASAGKRAAAAQAASTTASAATKQPLVDLAAVAGKLAEQMKAAPPPALDAQRKAFADLSKVFIALLVADPALQQGRYIFECPMAPSYKKWVQTHAKLQNPWYGSKMLECGVKADWSV